MNWQTIDELPYEDEEVLFTDGRNWWKGHLGGYYDYGQDRRIFPVWFSEGQVIEDVTHWSRIELPQ